MQSIDLDEIDNKIIELLKENARYSYSEIAEQVGLSRVAVKYRMQTMEQMGYIRGYEVKTASKGFENSVEFVVCVSPRPENYDYVVGVLAKNDLIQRVQASTGDCKVYAFGISPNVEKMDAFYRKIRTIFTDVRYFSFDVIASTYKDVDGGIKYEKPSEPGEKPEVSDTGRSDS